VLINASHQACSVGSGDASVTKPEPSGSTRAVVVLPLGHVRRQRSCCHRRARGSGSDRVADTARRSRLVGREDVSAVSGRSNRLGGLDPQPLAVELAVFCWVATTLSPILAGVRLARSTPVRRPTGGPRTVASHNHRLKPPRMFRPAATPKLVVGPSQRNGGRRSAPARTEGTPCGAAGRNRALARH
jgi:hypothetical protein